MTENQYNLRMIMFFALVIISVICLTVILIKEGKASGWFKTHFLIYKYVVIIISVIVCIVLLFYMISGIVYDAEEVSEVAVIEIIRNGSYAGIMDYYSLYVKFPDGTYLWVSTPLFSSKELKEQTELLKVGDTITIKYVSKIQSVYFIDKTGDGSVSCDSDDNQGTVL